MARGGGYSFSQVPMADIPRSSFNRSHGHKTTFNSGYLVPFFVDEALPGDTFSVKTSLFARLATPIVPIMDNLHMDVFFFAVPNRLVWDKWQRFCGERPNPDDSVDFTIPQVEAPASTGFAAESLFDYMGFPVGIPNISGSALWSRAYNLIFNEWFRDENLIDRAVVDIGDGPDVASNYVLRKRGKRHDYFTSCLPWPQKGEGVELPIGTSAPVVGNNPGGISMPTFKTIGGGTPSPFTQTAYPTGEAGFNQVGMGTQALAGGIGWESPALMVDLSSATAATINSLRQAFQIQKLLERDARGGTRYTEIIKAHFGVTSPDARLQRPEFLGGGSVPVIINPVSQTSGSGAYTDTPQGNLAGYGIAAGGNLGFSKSFVEHCVIIGMVMVRADLSYQQGMPRMFSRKTRFDYYWPAFAHIGEQAVLNREIYCQADTVIDPLTSKPINESVFGYQERWAEYRYYPSKITGKFRSTDPLSLDVWHLAQEFVTLPVLDKTFIEEAPPVERIVAVQTEPQFIFDSHISMKCTRPMPTYSVPGFIDHF
ncbi:MAG: major capsid protein [Microviridae sp.]|nr:MAG: major capsid protein [Microviridae sp.]